MKNLIGISGKKGSGKSEAGLIIQYLTSDFYPKLSYKRFKEKSHAAVEFGVPITRWRLKMFAHKLKALTAMILGCTVDDLEDQEYKFKPLGDEWTQWVVNEMQADGPPKEHSFISKEKAWWFYDILKDEYERMGNTKFEENFWKPIARTITPRTVIQKLGTDFGRDMIHPQIWVNALFADYNYDVSDWQSKETLLETFNEVTFALGLKQGNIEHDPTNDLYRINWVTQTSHWVITDVRFENEAQAILDRNGILIRVERSPKCPKCGERNTKTTDEGKVCKDCDYEVFPYTKAELHKSETELDRYEKVNHRVYNDGSIEDLVLEIEKILKQEKII